MRPIVAWRCERCGTEAQDPFPIQCTVCGRILCRACTLGGVTMGLLRHSIPQPVRCVDCAAEGAEEKPARH